MTVRQQYGQWNMELRVVDVVAVIVEVIVFPESLSVVVTLTPDQAFQGGHIRINFPASIRCSDCQGRGGIGFYECWRCGGAGSISGEYPVMVSYPPGIPDGQVVLISLERFGMRDAHLNVRFRISGLI